MRILRIHNYYQQRGGEDQSVEQDIRLLTKHGHDVKSYFRHNSEIKDLSSVKTGALLFESSWSWKSYREIGRILHEFRPDIAHFHNFLPLISPSAYYACAEGGVPVVQTLHNYRLLCPNALFFRSGRICEDCLGRSPWRSVLHSCYRDSWAQTFPIALMLATHRLLDTWSERVNIYIAMTSFSQNKFVDGGLPATKITVQPHCLENDPGFKEQVREYALFVGRLAPEKGLDTLLMAWEHLGGRIPLKIVGDGPSAPRAAESARRMSKITWLGYKPMEQVYELMRKATFLIFPSEWYETFGRVGIEAFGVGTPVIVSDIGAIAELVDPGRTGLHFQSGDPIDLAEKVEWAWTHPEQMRQMGLEARLEYEREYSAEQNLETLMAIYERAMEVK